MGPLAAIKSAFSRFAARVRQEKEDGIHHRWLRPLISCLAVAALTLTFFGRRPVYVVTDAPFTTLYGKERVSRARFFASVRLFRLVLLKPLAQDYETSAAASSLVSSTRRALFVVFPYRYAGVAVRYSTIAKENAGSSEKKIKKLPVALILANRSEKPADVGADNGVLFVPTDLERDFYRAGLCAAILSLHTAKEKALAAGKPETEAAKLQTAFFEDDGLSRQARTHFQAGLAAGGVTEEPVYRSLTSDYPASNLGSAVITGYAQAFISSNTAAPTVVFSWFEPSFFPPVAAIVFDDSPLMLTPHLARSLRIWKKTGEFPPVPAVFHFTKTTPRKLWLDLFKAGWAKTP